MSDSCNPMDWGTSGFPGHHQFQELAQTHVIEFSDAIQPSHPLSSPSPPAFNLAQHQGLFKWVNSSHQVAKVLELQIQHQSFRPSPQFKSINSLVLSFLYGPTLCNLTDCSMPGFTVLHCLPEFDQTHVHWVQWCHPTISSSAAPFSSCPQSFLASGSFPVSELFESGGQRIGASASASVLLMNTQDWSPLGWTGWIALQSKRLSRVFSNTTVQKHQFFSAQLSLWSNSHSSTWLLAITIALIIWAFVGKVMFLLFNTLSRLVIAVGNTHPACLPSDGVKWLSLIKSSHTGRLAFVFIVLKYLLYNIILLS